MAKKSVRTSSRDARVKQLGIPVDARRIPATAVKNRFGDVLETVLRGQPALITKHGEAKALIISVQEFSTVSSRPEAELNTLTEEFDQLLKRMQTAKARSAMQAAFEAPPEELGLAAVRAVRRS